MYRTSVVLVATTVAEARPSMFLHFQAQLERSNNGKAELPSSNSTESPNNNTDAACSADCSEQHSDLSPNTHALTQTVSQIETLCRQKNFHLPPLFFAVCSNNAVALRLLLTHGASYEAVDFDGNTCLHVAAARQHAGILCSSVLIEHGAMTYRPNAVGVKPVDLFPHLRTLQERLVKQLLTFSPSNKHFTVSDSSSAADNCSKASATLSTDKYSGNSAKRSKKLSLAWRIGRKSSAALLTGDRSRKSSKSRSSPRTRRSKSSMLSASSSFNNTVTNNSVCEIDGRHTLLTTSPSIVTDEPTSSSLLPFKYRLREADSVITIHHSNIPSTVRNTPASICRVCNLYACYHAYQGEAGLSLPLYILFKFFYNSSSAAESITATSFFTDLRHEAKTFVS